MSLPVNVLVACVRSVLAVAMIAIPIAVISVGHHFEIHGGRILSVQTGSMRPVFNPGDAVIVWRTSPTSLRVGDIVAYHSRLDPRVVISHRIVTKGPGHSLITKGDSVSRADAPIDTSVVIGRVRGVAPDLGSLLTWLKSPLGLTLLIYLPAAIVIGRQLWLAIRYYQPSGYRLRR